MRRALAAVLLVGCSHAAAPAAIDLTVVADTSVPDTALASMQSLGFVVSGVENAEASYPLLHPFADHRQERVVYQPKAKSGTLTFTVEASDAVGAPVAGGSAEVKLGTGNAIAATVTIGVDAMPTDDMMSSMPDDLTPGPDLAGFCATAADGTACGSADSCNDAPTCAAGVCVQHPKPDGTVCASTTNVCKISGTCRSGVCGAIANKPAGTVCNPKSNPCHTDGTCDGNGTCGAQGVQPTGYQYDATYQHRCCGGNPTDVFTDVHNCGVCGIDCNGGSCAALHNAHYCTCTSNAQCWSNCCSIAYGTPYTCAAGNCSTNLMIPCPGNGINSNNSNGPYYCHY